MKKVKIICMFLVVFFVAFSMAGCVTPWVKREHPISFLGSTWESEDGKIRFTVDLYNTGFHYGVKIQDGNSVEMIFESNVAWYGIGGMEVAEYDSMEPDEYGFKSADVSWAETWESYRFKELKGSDNFFTVEVLHSTIYEEGELVRFYRIDEAKNIMVKEFKVADYKQQIDQYLSNKTLAVSEDIETAVFEARCALEQEFGTLSDKLEACYDNEEGCWLVKGTHRFEFLVSVPHIIFRTDGTVLAMWKE